MLKRQQHIRKGLTVGSGLVAFVGLFLVINHTILRGQWIRDIELYFEYSQQILTGQIPYLDFAAEYPPAAFLAMLPPQLLAQGNLERYRIFFAAENILFMFLGALLILVIAPTFNYHLELQSVLRWVLKWGWVIATIAVILAWLSPLVFLIVLILSLIIGIRQTTLLNIQQKQALSAYGIYILILSPIWLWRYDFFVVLLTLITLLGLRQFRPVVVGVSLALGILAKLYPIVMLPPIAFSYLIQRNYHALTQFMGAMVITLMMSITPFLWLDAQQFIAFLGYHQERPLQLESLPAGVAILLHQWNGLTVEKVFSHSSEGLVFAGDRVILSLLPYLFIGLACLGSYWIWRCFSQQHQQTKQVSLTTIAQGCLIMHLVFILSNKVFSPQYVLWLLPFVLLLGQRDRIVYLVICLLTILVYPTFYDRLMESWSVALLLNMRNGLMVVWVVLLIRTLPILVHSSSSTVVLKSR
ncbi:MAG: glycosyltransferase 87 family protein [Spirulinaceae cyanobacterium]